MFEKQEIKTIAKEELLEKVQALADEDYRIVQICCTKVENTLQVDYTFDKDYKFYGMRVELSDENPELPSISGIYFAAFLYENEIHDLFGIQVNNMKVDFKGNLYRIEEDKPFVKDRSQEK